MARKQRATGVAATPSSATGRRPGGSRRGAAAVSDEEIPVVGQREPCPCGSGRRYKACDGRPRREETGELVRRPFEALPGETEWVALREIVPAATAEVRTTAAHGAETVLVTTVLPMAVPAMRRSDGQLMVGLQTTSSSGDPSRDVAAALLEALAVAPGEMVGGIGQVPAGPRLQDVIETTGELDVQVHSGFDFWLAEGDETEPVVRESMERANAAIIPTVRLRSVPSAYWCEISGRRHLRWVFGQAEDDLLNALARLHAERATALVEGARCIGAFRAHGLLVPVWDLPRDVEAEDLETPAKVFADRVVEALAVTDPLTPEQRRSRDGLVSRQLTLR